MAKKTEAKKATGKGKASAEAVKDTAALRKMRDGGALPELPGKGKKSADEADSRTAGALKKAEKNLSTTVAMSAEVLPPETASEALLKHASDVANLRSIELCIETNLNTSRRLDLASTGTGVTIGTALRAAKAIIKPGLYESWVKTTFPNFSERQAQYYGKLSDVFLRETSERLALPPAKEMGTFMMRANQENGPFAEAVKSFVGNMTMAELLDKYRIKPKKAKGGHRPGSYMVKRYQDEHPHLANKPFEVWGEKDQTAFHAWLDLEVKADNGSATINAAEGVWTTIRDTLTVQGINKKSFAVLPKDALTEISRVLGLVKANVDDALKGMKAK